MWELKENMIKYEETIENLKQNLDNVIVEKTSISNRLQEIQQINLQLEKTLSESVFNCKIKEEKNLQVIFLKKYY